MRVLVFRVAEAAAKTAQELDAAGHEAVLAPVMRIVGTAAPLPSGRFDAILATSANAFASGRAGLDTLRHLPVFAVGQATRKAARQQEFLDVRSSEGDASALVALLRLTLPRPARLLYLAGRDRKPAIETSLGEAGYTVETLVAYDACAVEDWPDEAVSALRQNRVEAALHFSRRSVDLALDLASRHDLRAAVLGLAQCCLSEDVAAPLRAAGAADIRVASRPDEAGVLTLLRPGGR